MGKDLMTQFEEQVKDLGRPLKLDGLDAAIIGVADCWDPGQVIVYDREKIVRIFIRQGMTRGEAQEYIDYNIVGSLPSGFGLLCFLCNLTDLRCAICSRLDFLA